MMGLEDKPFPFFLILIIIRYFFQGCTSENEGNDPMTDLRKYFFMALLHMFLHLVYFHD